MAPFSSMQSSILLCKRLEEICQLTDEYEQAAKLRVFSMEQASMGSYSDAEKIANMILVKILRACTFFGIAKIAAAEGNFSEAVHALQNIDDGKIRAFALKAIQGMPTRPLRRHSF